MTTLATALRQKLEGDATLTTLATGGIWDNDEIATAGYGGDGLTLEVITAADSPLVLPSIYVKMTTTAPLGPVKVRAQDWFSEIYFYDQANFTTIRLMQARVYALLHQAQVTFTQPSNWFCREIQFAGHIVNEWKDPALGDACMSASRYRLVTIELVEGY